MAARLLQLRRALSLLQRNQVGTTSIFQGQSRPLLPPANAFFKGSDFYRKLIQTQTNSTAQINEGSDNNESATSNPPPELAGALPSNSTEALDVKHKVVSHLKINARHDFMMIFTCKVCETRSLKMACRQSYEKGIVVARCPGCNNLHLIADRLGWFGEPGSIENFLAARGEEVKRDSLDSLNLTLEELAGKKTSKE